MREVQEPPLRVPAVLAPNTNEVSRLNGDPGRDGCIVNHQEGLAAPQADDEPLVGNSPAVVFENADHPAFGRQENRKIMIFLENGAFGAVLMDFIYKFYINSFCVYT